MNQLPVIAAYLERLLQYPTPDPMFSKRCQRTGTWIRTTFYRDPEGREMEHVELRT